MIASVAKYPDRFRVIGRVSLEAGITPNEEEIALRALSPKLVGLRLVLYTEESVARFKSGFCDWMWRWPETVIYLSWFIHLADKNSFETLRLDISTCGSPLTIYPCP